MFVHFKHFNHKYDLVLLIYFLNLVIRLSISFNTCQPDSQHKILDFQSKRRALGLKSSFMSIARCALHCYLWIYIEKCCHNLIFTELRRFLFLQCNMYSILNCSCNYVCAAAQLSDYSLLVLLFLVSVKSLLLLLKVGEEGILSLELLMYYCAN